MVNAANSGLGYEVLVGLLAGPADLARLRAAVNGGPLARLWRQFMKQVEGNAGGGTLLPVADMALAAAVTCRVDLADKAITRALDTAHQPHWVHAEAGCIGLTGVHHAHALALLVDWLWPVLLRDQREALLGALVAKAQENLTRAPAGVRNEDDQGQLLFVRRMDKDDRFCMHPHSASVNNWDMWFSSGIYMIAALAERAWLAPDPAWPALEWGHYYDVGYRLDAARIARWKGVALDRITTGLASQLGPDGDYAEGAGYANYGGRAMLHALHVLERVDGLDHWPAGMARLPYWLHNQYVADIAFGAANFNDSRLQIEPAFPLLAHIASRMRDPQVQGCVEGALEASDAAPDMLLLLGLATDLPGAPMSRPPAVLYEHTGQVTWRTAEDRTGVFFSLKSGAHGGAHQHRDRNTFVLSAYGEHLIADTGDGRKATPLGDPPFDTTAAHNAVLIDGRGQVGSNQNPVTGRILEHTHADELSTLLADASDCYEGADSVRRRVVFVRPDLLVIADRVKGECGTLTWLLQGCNLDGKAAWELGDRCAVLSRPGAKLYVFLAETATRQHVAVAPLDAVQQGIMRLENDIPGRAVTALLVPARADDPPPTCARDGNTLTVQFRGSTHTVGVEDEAVAVNGQEFRV